MLYNTRYMFIFTVLQQHVIPIIIDVDICVCVSILLIAFIVRYDK